MVFGVTELWANAGVFLLGAAIVGAVGPRLSRAADAVGAVTELGQSLAGALLLGASTSLPGLIVSLQTALQGNANLAVANAIGGIAAQTFFIALADVALRSGTIEHEGAMADSLMQTTVLITLLTVLLLGMLEPRYSIYGAFHPVSLVVAVGVVLGFRAIQHIRKHPSWRARSEGGDGDEEGSGDGDKAGNNGESGTESEDGDGRGRTDSDGRDSNAGRSSGETSGEPDYSGRRERTPVDTVRYTVRERLLSFPVREKVVTYSVRREEDGEDRRRPSDSRATRTTDRRESTPRSAGSESDTGPRNGGRDSESETDSSESRSSEDGAKFDSSTGDGGSDSSGSDGSGQSKGRVLRRYAIYLTLIAVAGYLISSATGVIISRTGVSPVVAGLTLTAPATSLPELVTAVSSVRRGRVALGIGDIVGGNAFDTIMVAIADFAYVAGTIYLAVSDNVVFITALALLMSATLAVGFVHRDRRNLAGIGVESYLIIVVYLLGIASVLVGTLV